LIKDYYFDLVQTYDESEEKLKVIISKAEAEQTHWESVIETFNKRFSVPFSIRVENKGDAVLNLDSPQIVFYFNDENDEPIKKIDRDLLDSVLSNGEKRALYILNIIFEVEDLSVASPATVSRAGMIYIDPNDLGWRAYIDTWISRIKDESV